MHFGEVPKWQTCGACDVCSGSPDWLKPAPTHLRVPKSAAKTPAPAAEVNPELLEYMRAWRREISHGENIPAFMVLSDASLQDLCHKNPRDMTRLRQVVGIGEKKAQSYGALIFEALESFQRGARATKPELSKESPLDETVRLLNQGRSFEEIATLRERRLSTIVETVANGIENGKIQFDERWIGAQRLAQIEAAVAYLGLAKLKPIKDALPPDFTYDEIRLAVSYLKRRADENAANQSLRG
jgi:ATP-dependent DNA helicase RecQ